MSPNEDVTKAARGQRAFAIRKDSGLEPKAFAAAADAMAKRLGLETGYPEHRVSKLCNGQQPLSLDDVLVFLRLDKRKRGLEWLALGDRRAGFEVDEKPTAEKKVAAGGRRR